MSGGLRGPLWGSACVPYCGHKSTGAVFTATGHGLMSSRGGHTLTMAFLQSVSTRWLKAAGAELGRNWGWALPAAPWRSPSPWKAAQGSRGVRPGGLLGLVGPWGLETVWPEHPALLPEDPHSLLVPLVLG